MMCSLGWCLRKVRTDGHPATQVAILYRWEVGSRRTSRRCHGRFGRALLEYSRSRTSLSRASPRQAAAVCVAARSLHESSPSSARRGREVHDACHVGLRLKVFTPLDEYWRGCGGMSQSARQTAAVAYQSRDGRSTSSTRPAEAGAYSKWHQECCLMVRILEGGSPC
jgi:hypothetical protein